MQKTAFEVRISDWGSEVCSSDLREEEHGHSPERPCQRLHRWRIAHPIAIAFDKPFANMLRLLPGQYALPNLGAHITSHADVAVSDGLALTYETPDGFHQRLGLRFQLRVLKQIGRAPV